MQPIDPVTLLQDLIACPSMTPNDAGCQTIVGAHLKKLGFHCESFPTAGVTNLWARLGTAAPLFCFAGHTDVVPPGELSTWTSPPFTPTRRDGHLYGRGACDMKGALAAMIAAVSAALAEKPLTGSIAFLLTSDEEGPAIHGTQFVLEQLKARHEKIDYCLVGEPVSEKTLGDTIMIGRRGSLHGKLTIHGKLGHIARPALAKNPIHLSLRALTELIETTWDDSNPAPFPETSLQISNAKSGEGALNVIPDRLVIDFNFRHGTHTTIDTLKERVEEILKAHHLSFELAWSIGAQPFLTSPARLAETATTIIQNTLGYTPKLSTHGGTSDGRFLAAYCKEVIELGALCHTAHHVDENIAVKDLLDLTVLYKKIVQTILPLK